MEVDRDRPVPSGPAGQHQSLSAVDWLICATAAHHGLVVLHDDADFRAAARLLSDLAEHNVIAAPR
ncbi:PIN domain-containing protein [Streptomyces violaceusniger]|uniref:PIN domain-containing protein n=1 Tax=Streptomyces violaceusniger TaxID=68280 RepID=UPI00342C9257